MFHPFLYSISPTSEAMHKPCERWNRGKLDFVSLPCRYACFQEQYPRLPHCRLFGVARCVLVQIFPPPPRRTWNQRGGLVVSSTRCQLEVLSTFSARGYTYHKCATSSNERKYLIFHSLPHSFKDPDNPTSICNFRNETKFPGVTLVQSAYTPKEFKEPLGHEKETDVILLSDLWAFCFDIFQQGGQKRFGKRMFRKFNGA